MYDANSVSILRVDNDSHYQDCRIDFDIHSQLENDFDSHYQNLFENHSHQKSCQKILDITYFYYAREIHFENHSHQKPCQKILDITYEYVCAILFQRTPDKNCPKLIFLFDIRAIGG